MTELHTQIQEPSLDAGEVEMMLFALERARAQFAWKCGGLDAAGLHRRFPPSAMTIGGLLKHLALVEDARTAEWITRQPLGAPWNAVDFEADRDWEWRTAADNTPDELYALWRDAVDRSRAAWTTVLAAGGLDQPSRYATPSGEHPNLRWTLVDLIEEYNRHTGHADLFREAIDGLVGEGVPQPR